MMGLVLTAELGAGASVRQGVYDAITLATLTGCFVRVQLETVTLVAQPGINPATCFGRVERALAAGQALVT